MPVDEATERQTDPPPPPDDPLVGEVLGGRYAVVRKEHEDAEVATYLAAHTRVPGAMVHVHVIASDLRSSKSDRARFRGTWELHTLFESERDHILRIDDIWSEESVGEVVVTEALSGYRLDEWLARNTSPPPLDKAVEWTRQLAMVLEVMHAAGVTHGDLRSEIIRLANVGPHQIVKLTSFGTRRNCRQVSKLGPGCYRAPEHALGGVAVGVKSNVWSYGMLAYELLSGRRFWRADTTTDALTDVDVDSYLAERSELVRGVSSKTFEVWMRSCLRHDPAERFGNVVEASKALQGVIAVARTRYTPPLPRAAPRPEPPPDGRLSGGAALGSPLVSPVVAVDARVMRGDKNTVWGLCVAPDGRSVFTVGDEGVVRAWDPASGALQREYGSGHAGPVRCVAVSPDGRRLITGGRNRAVVIRDLRDESREPMRSAQHRSVVTSVQVAPGGHWMLSTSEDGTAVAWDLVHERVIWSTSVSQKCVHAAVIAKDQDTFITAGRDGVVRRWSLRAQRCLESLDGHQGDIYALALSADGKTLVSAGRDGQIFEWVQARRARVFRGPRDMVTAVAWGGDERWLATGSSDPDVRVWDFASGECLQTLKEDEWVVRAVAFDPRGRYLCSSGSGGDLRVWSIGA